MNGVDDPNESEEEPSIVKEEKGADIANHDDITNSAVA